MDEKILTVTIPSYNAQKYLNKCLDSFIVTDVLKYIEILIVNDGSTDDTAQIAQTYVDRFPDSFKLINKENGGHGSGINTGVQNATGKYFKVVDADDWVNTSEFGGFVEMLKTSESDVISSDFMCIEDETYDVIKRVLATEIEDRYGKECNLSDIKLDRVVKMHNMTIKTSILKEHYRPIDEHCFYVDAEYITYPVPYINTVYYDKRDVYIYRLGRTGQSVTWDSMARNKDMHLRVLTQLVKFYDEVSEQISGHKLEYLKRCIGDMIDNQFQIYIVLGDDKNMQDELRHWDKNMKRTHPDLYNSISKKSIYLIRFTNYAILPVGKLAHRLIKGE
ncbi:MAG: glycosyltransferase [Lachnospiraceae bacterium]|nr:glycosyltransferase [Lachnospiraceae bacterium]